MSVVDKVQRLRERFGVIKVVVPERTTVKEKTRGFNVVAAKNLPIAHSTRIWAPDRDISKLPAVDGTTFGGPTKTMYAETFINPKLFETVQEVTRDRATRDFRDGEANVAMDGIREDSKASRPTPRKSKDVRKAQMNSSEDPEQGALDGHEKVHGFFPSEIVAIDDRGFFGQLLTQFGFGQLFTQFSQSGLGQMFRQMKPNLLGNFIEKKPRDRMSSVISGRTGKSEEVVA